MKTPTVPSPTYDLLLGLDRADAKADVQCLHPATGNTWRQTIPTAPEALAQWLAALRQEYPLARAALCLEQPAGNLLAFFEPYAWLTLYPINPITLQKFREAFVTSRAKDDGQDAAYLTELLRTHADKLTPWQPEDSATRLVQQRVGNTPTRGSSKTCPARGRRWGRGCWPAWAASGSAFPPPRRCSATAALRR